MSVYTNHFDGYNTHFTVIDDRRKICSIEFESISHIILPNNNTCSITFSIPYTNTLEPSIFIKAVEILREELANLTELTQDVILMSNWITHTQSSSIGYVCSTPLSDTFECRENPVFFKISRNEELCNYTYIDPNTHTTLLMTDVEFQLHLRRALIENNELIKTNLDILLEKKQY